MVDNNKKPATFQQYFNQQVTSPQNMSSSYPNPQTTTQSMMQQNKNGAQSQNQQIPSHPVSTQFQDLDVMYQVPFGHFNLFLEYLLAKFELDYQFHVNHSKEITKLHYEGEPTNPYLKQIKQLLNCDCFTMVNKKDNPGFTRVEAIIYRYEQYIQTLKLIIEFNRKENIQRDLTFFNEDECKRCFRKIFPEEYFENKCFLNVSQQYYRYVRAPSYKEPNSTNTTPIFEILKLMIYGISFPTQHIEDYPLHQAVFNGNLPMIRKLCTDDKSPTFICNVEQADPLGMTALMLATRIGNKDAVLILSNLGTDPKHRCYPYARTPLEDAVESKNRGLVKSLLIASHCYKQQLWEDNKGFLINLLRKIPDFTFEMNWECDSKIIPFVKKFAPSDTYTIYKYGDSLRIDLSLLGWKKMKSIRGESSILFNGKGTNEEGRLLLIDHQKRASADLLGDMNTLKLENKVDNLIKQEQVNSEIKAENVTFKPATNWKNDLVQQDIEGYNCIKYNAKATFSMMFTKRNILVDLDASKYADFEQYFGFCMKNPLWIFQSDVYAYNSSPINHVILYLQQMGQQHVSDKNGKETTVQLSKKEIERLSSFQKKLYKQYQKSISAAVYLTDSFPLNLEVLFPILDILSNVSPQINRLKDFLDRKNTMNRSSFPLKAYIPVFFSVNAIISLRDFQFKSPEPKLFELKSLLQSTPGKRKSDQSSTFYNEAYDRCRTEGGSDDENVQKCWEEILRNDQDSSEDGDYLIKNGGKGQYAKNKFQYVEEIDDQDFDRDKEKIIKSFFKNKGSVVNQDFVNVYDEDEKVDEDENLDDLEISEKFRNETLKLSNHTPGIPKTIMTIQDKCKSTQSFTMLTTASTENIHKPMVNTRNFGKFNGPAIKTPTSSSSTKFTFSKQLNTQTPQGMSSSAIQGSKLPFQKSGSQGIFFPPAPCMDPGFKKEDKPQAIESTYKQSKNVKNSPALLQNYSIIKNNQQLTQMIKKNNNTQQQQLSKSAISTAQATTPSSNKQSIVRDTNRAQTTYAQSFHEKQTIKEPLTNSSTPQQYIKLKITNSAASKTPQAASSTSNNNNLKYQGSASYQQNTVSKYLFQEPKQKTKITGHTNNQSQQQQQYQQFTRSSTTQGVVAQSSENIMLTQGQNENLQNPVSLQSPRFKFMQNLNSKGSSPVSTSPLKKSQTDQQNVPHFDDMKIVYIKESLTSLKFNEREFRELTVSELDKKDTHLKKLNKYVTNQQNLKSRLNTQENSQSPENIDDRIADATANLSPKRPKRGKHERIKSLDFVNQSNDKIVGKR